MSQKLLAISAVLLGLIATFIGGYLFYSFSKPCTTTSLSTSTKCEASLIDASEKGTKLESTKFVPGKFYASDTITLISKEAPYITLVATIDRNEQNKGFLQTTRVSFYDGKNWTRKIKYQYTKDSTAETNEILKKWEITVDASLVLKQTNSAQLMVDKNDISIETFNASNEIGMRSLPGYTKFMSNSQGNVGVNGKKYASNILYTRIYSLNSGEIPFYDKKMGLTTDWAVMWDKLGNLYHIDSTQLTKPTPIYQSHQIGVVAEQNGAVTKTFGLDITRDSNIPPSKFSIKMAEPINKTLAFNLLSSMRKEPESSYIWFVGNIKGTVTNTTGEKVDAVGIFEFVKE